MEIFGFTVTMSVFWLILMIVFLLIEAMSVGLTSIWFAVSAFVALLIAFVGGPIWLQVAVFLILSICLLAFTRKFFMEKLKMGSEKTNANALIGEKALVITKIEPYQGGRVRVNGQEWAAIAKKIDLPIEENQMVKVVAIEGVKLIVSPQ